MRKISSQCKLCRREGEKLFLKGERCNSPKCAMVKKNYKPGLHGPKKMMSKMSAYGKQLREKQKTKRIYGLLEKPFFNLVKKALKDKKNSGKTLISLLEYRFDNIVYNLKLASSRNSARQLISHGHFKINGKPVDISSYRLKVGDQIEVKENKAKEEYWKARKETLKNEKNIPTWLSLDSSKLKAQVTGEVNLDEAQKNIDTSLIIEFYSR